jgi:hypothetical protein
MQRRRLVAAVLLPLVAACSSLRPVPDPLQFISQTRPSLVYVSYGIGITMMMEHPRVSGDSVRGITPGSREEVALAVTEVQSVSTVRLNKARTAALVGGLAVAGGVVAYAVLAGANGKSDFTCDYNEPTQNNGPRCGFDP